MWLQAHFHFCPCRLIMCESTRLKPRIMNKDSVPVCFSHFPQLLTVSEFLWRFMPPRLLLIWQHVHSGVAFLFTIWLKSVMITHRSLSIPSPPSHILTTPKIGMVLVIPGIEQHNWLRHSSWCCLTGLGCEWSLVFHVNGQDKAGLSWTSVTDVHEDGAGKYPLDVIQNEWQWTLNTTVCHHCRSSRTWTKGFDRPSGEEIALPWLDD